MKYLKKIIAVKLYASLKIYVFDYNYVAIDSCNGYTLKKYLSQFYFRNVFIFHF